jgi:N-acetylglucosamine-6-phosphate deacetylase
LEPGAVVIEAGRIAAIVREPHDGDLPERVIDAATVAPGLIDLQVNGGYGVEIGDDPAAMRHLSACLPSAGVTAYLPTFISANAHQYAQAFAAFEAGKDAAGAKPLGLHLEGPFLSPIRAGAHRREALELADDALFETLLAAESLRLMTLAPERPGAEQRIRKLVERGVLVSLGHTNATYEQFEAGVAAGARMATHLYNAMSAFGHRSPGAIGAALVDSRVTVGLIADGIHSHPASIELAVRAKGPARIALVSDLMQAAGMPPGNYELGGQTVIVDGSTARLPSGALAGSIVTLDQAIRNVVQWTDATPAQAVQMASEIPARLLKLPDRGRIAAGFEADLVLFDADLNVEMTIVRGEILHHRETARV